VVVAPSKLFTDWQSHCADV